MSNTEKTNWVSGVDYPEFMIERSLTTLKDGYLVGNETPNDALRRVARRVAELTPSSVYDGELEEDVYNCLKEGDVGLSSPIWSNFGTSRGLPISCFGSYIGDSITSIYYGLSENAKMSQLGGGTSSYWGHVRERGSGISGQTGTTGGPFEFMENYDSMIKKVSQGGTRRGSHAVYIDFKHNDAEEILDIRRVGCNIQKLFSGISISKDDIHDIYSGEPRALRVWSKVLESRNQTGLPYLFFKDNINGGLTTPPWYGLNKTQILASNLCSEIMLPSNENESFVCCLVSMNAMNYDRWRCNNSVRLAVIILEAVMEEFIIKTTGIEEMKRARRFAINHRALGLGLLGYHSYLQSKNIPFIGLQSTALTTSIMKRMKEEAEAASEALAKILGNAPVIEHYNNKYGTKHVRRHTTLLAIAPTTSNATIAGGISAGIEPLPSNYYVQKSAKGVFTVVNPFLTKLIESKYPEYNTVTTWNSIRDNVGSVQHLHWMEDSDKQVFATFREINQFELVKLAAVRQKYLDQSQSLNVFIDPATPAHLVSSLYLMGAELGIKSFYYQRSSNTLRDKSSGTGNSAMDPSACTSCEG